MNNSKLIELANSTIVSSALDIIGINFSVIDVNGRYITQNKSMETAISMGLILAESIDKPSWENCKQVMLNRRKELKEEKFKDRYFLSLKQPLIENNNCVGILVLSLDITEQKKSHIAKQEFLKNIAHDIRTPLAGIIGLAQLQEMGLQSLAESKEYGQMICGASNQLLELLNAVIGTIDTEQMIDPVKLEPLDLSGLAKELHALMQPSIYTKELKFNLDVDPDLPIILGDRIKLKRILLNILSNAVKFTEVGETNFIIKLLAIENNQVNVEMKISDTGIGIAKENIDKIFDRFYRANPSYLGKYPGYGLGLYLAKQILEILGGDINVESEEGKGTCFTLHFNFPIADARSHKTEPVLPSPSKAQPAGPILIAEDNPVVLHGVKKLLENAGYEVIATKDGKAALEALKNNYLAWALLDLGLPEFSGTEAVKQYRQWEKENNKQHLPIFALTGHSLDEVGKESKEAGIDQVFIKPLTNKIIQEIEALN